MLKELQRREAEGTPIKVGLIGAGAMGAGIAWQVNRTPGMEVVFIGDIDLAAAHNGAEVPTRPAGARARIMRRRPRAGRAAFALSVSCAGLTGSPPATQPAHGRGGTLGARRSHPAVNRP